MQHPCYFFTKFDNSFAFFDGRDEYECRREVRNAARLSVPVNANAATDRAFATTVWKDFLTYDLNFAEELNVVEGAAPFSVLIAVSHAAKTNALKHIEFNNEWRDVFHIGNRGHRHCFFHHVPFDQFITRYIGKFGSIFKCP